jgi:hypothetical protein
MKLRKQQSEVWASCFELRSGFSYVFYRCRSFVRRHNSRTLMWKCESAVLNETSFGRKSWEGIPRIARTHIRMTPEKKKQNTLKIYSIITLSHCHFTSHHIVTLSHCHFTSHCHISHYDLTHFLHYYMIYYYQIITFSDSCFCLPCAYISRNPISSEALYFLPAYVLCHFYGLL